MEHFRRKIQAYLQENRDAIVGECMDLIRIPSVRDEALPNAPYGKACADVLLHTKSVFSYYGFSSEIDHEGGYLLSSYGEGDRSIGLFAHADVVPAGDNWTLTQPFAPTVINGCIVGRGALDDKSAVVIALHAVRIIRDLFLPFHARLVTFVGSAEESGMDDIKHYIKTHTPPDFALVPDTGFPLYRGNKGRILMHIKRNAPLGEIKRFCGGKSGTNVGYAEVVLPYREDLYFSLLPFASDNITVYQTEEGILITARGIEKHSALPDGSVNAAALIADFLRTSNFVTDETCRICAFLYDICADYHGTALGVANSDTEFGPLTFVHYRIDADETSAALDFNIRLGASVDADVMKQTLRDRFTEYGFSMEISSESYPHIVPADHPVLRAMISTYEAVTGTQNAPMYVNAGGTYGQYLPCAAEIGTSMRWNRPTDLPVGHGAVHQPDEWISIDGLLDAIEMTVLMLLACDNAMEENKDEADVYR